MKKIYCLKLGDHVFYIGQTKLFLSYRLAAHLGSTPGIKELPDWIKRLIQIETLEECQLCYANSKERWWIKKYALENAPLLNNNHRVERATRVPKYTYKTLTKIERDFIRYEIGYCKIAKAINILPETLRIAIVKNRMKKEYYDKIFSPDNLLKFNEYVEKCNNVA